MDGSCDNGKHRRESVDSYGFFFYYSVKGAETQERAYIRKKRRHTQGSNLGAPFSCRFLCCSIISSVTFLFIVSSKIVMWKVLLAEIKLLHIDQHKTNINNPV